MDADPKREHSRGAAIRDLIAGAALIAIGVITNTTSFDGRADAIDYVFDTLGAIFILWAIVRLVRGSRTKAQDRRPA